jgi:hypothetical protein
VTATCQRTTSAAGRMTNQGALDARVNPRGARVTYCLRPSWSGVLPVAFARKS